MPKYNEPVQWYKTIEASKAFKSMGEVTLHLTAEDVDRLNNGEVLAVSVNDEYSIVIVHDDKHPTDMGDAPIGDGVR